MSKTYRSADPPPLRSTHYVLLLPPSIYTARVDDTLTPRMEASHPHALTVARPPVIILGMHRSGTSLVARLLDELGLFQGNELQEDHESVYFMEVNDLLLRRVGASWDNPGPVRAFLRNPQALDLTARCVR